MFALAIIGSAGVIAQDWRQGVVFAVFPLVYMLYFSTQGTMVVRNLLAVASFWAVAAAHGASMLCQFLERNRVESTAQLPRPALAGAVWVALLFVTVGVNGSWLIASAESIVSRHTDRSVRETSQYVSRHPDTKFLLSPRIKRDLTVVGPSPNNVTDDPSEAGAFVLYAREGMLRWHDWQANRRGLTQASFGPRAVNFDMYPNWWGDDRILVINRARAKELGLRIAGISRGYGTGGRTACGSTHNPIRRLARLSISTDSLPRSWTLPLIDPRTLVPRAEAEATVGPLARGLTAGGWELDGSVCTYLSQDGVVVSVAIVSTGGVRSRTASSAERNRFQRQCERLRCSHRPIGRT